MKRLVLITCLAVVLVFAAPCAWGAELIFGFPQATATLTDAGGGTVRPEAPDFSSMTSPGDPALPVKETFVLLPPTADVRTIQVQIRNEGREELPGTYDIAPCPPMVYDRGDGPVLDWGSAKKIVGGRNQLTYGIDAPYPSACVSTSFESHLGKYLLVPVKYWPYQYNPITKKLVHITGGDVVISFATNEMLLAKTAASAAGGSDRLKDLAANWEQASSWYGDTAQSDSPSPMGAPANTLLILTTSAVQTASTKLADFVAHKTDIGWTVNLVTESAWGGGTGDAAAENIRSYLKTVYTNYQYLLLIGDPTPATGEMAMKIVYPFDEPNQVGTDYYFADLTGNWDLNGNGLYGENRSTSTDFGTGGVDRVPELYVGRIPYYGVIADLDHILQKTMDYEDATTVGGWVQRALLPMVPLDTRPGYATLSYYLGQDIRTNVCLPVGLGYYRLYAEDYAVTPVPEAVPCDETSVLSAWQQHYGFVFWMTHGSSTSASSVFSTSSVPNLDDDYPAFTFQASCLNAQPDVSYNLAYSLLKNGAVSTVAATHLSILYFCVTNYTNIDDVGGMCYAYAYRLARSRQNAAKALWDMKLAVPFSLWQNHVEFVLYGDPTLAPRWPTEFSITTTAIPPGMRTRSYRCDLFAAGSNRPYVWTKTSGTLPMGVSLASSGYLTGTPTAAGTYTFTLQCRSSSSPALTDSREYTLVIKDPISVTTTSPLPGASTQQSYSVNLRAAGGTPPYRWTASTTLPSGLYLSSSGVLSGTPSATGTSSFTVRVMDSNRYSTARVFSLTTTLTYIATTSLPIACGGLPYEATLQAGGGEAPYTWSLASGQLPTGLTLSTDGVISGTPRKLGAFNPTIKATSSTGESTTRPFIMPALVLAYSFPLDTDPGWSTQGDWAFGQPTGGGSHMFDPTSGHTGTNVYGFNLAGDYINYMPAYYLTTTPLDLSNLTCATLSFWRWLGVEGYYDNATVEASSDNTNWSVIWDNDSQTYSESAWSLQTYDISNAVDRKSTAYLRWCMGATDVSVVYPGWNIDDIEILGVPIATAEAGSIAEAKSLPDDSSYKLGGKVVSAVFTDCFYIQEPGGYQGIRIPWTYGGMAAGNRAMVQGHITTTNGEREIVPDYIQVDTTQSTAVRPVFTQLSVIGGSGYALQGGVVDGKWVAETCEYSPAVGLGDTGCLVRVSGKVTQIGEGYFYVDDGSGHKTYTGGLTDGTLTGETRNVGVRVSGSPGTAASGQQVTVTGISSGFMQDGHFVRLIKPTGVLLVSP